MITTPIATAASTIRRKSELRYWPGLAAATCMTAAAREREWVGEAGDPIHRQGARRRMR
jgi:hypothetical protein